MALSAGAVHLGQIPPHADEDPTFVLFFFVVGVLQIGGGLYLAYPAGPRKLRRGVFSFGVLGSVTTIAIWAISRTLGLPFGAEPAVPQTVGLADAAADLFELFTALLLFVWLLGISSSGSRRALAIGGMSGAFGLAIVWGVLRASGRFDPDPRLVLHEEFVDAAAIGFLVLVGGFFARLVFMKAGHMPLLARFHVLAVFIAALALVGLTLPARGGQNRDCAYAPIREDSGLTHATTPLPIPLRVGERTSVAVLLLVACADAPVELTGVTLLGPPPDAVGIEAITIDPSRAGRPARVGTGPSGVPAIGTMLIPGHGRYPLLVTVRGIRAGRVALAAFRLDFTFKGDAGSIGFASVTSFCVDQTDCG